MAETGRLRLISAPGWMRGQLQDTFQETDDMGRVSGLSPNGLTLIQYDEATDAGHGEYPGQSVHCIEGSPVHMG